LYRLPEAVVVAVWVMVAAAAVERAADVGGEGEREERVAGVAAVAGGSAEREGIDECGEEWAVRRGETVV
jgi:hypothetical protein